MSVERQFNWQGQQRVDVPHLRTLDSSNSNDFDNLAGQSLAGGQALVVRGFVLVTTGAIGLPATNLFLQVDPGIVWHTNASEAGTVFRTAVGTPAEQLTSVNPKVNGSFTASQLNYVGIDLLRSSDPTTSDLVEFLDADTLKEEPETVPLARTLNYSIVISTTSFTSQPNVLPIALVTTDGSNNVVSIVDARNMAFRLGTGGTIPNPSYGYPWAQGRNETARSITNGGDGFSGGDKVFGSLREATQAMESRLQELGGGPFWYSATSDRHVKLVRNVAARFSTGDNFYVNPGDGNLWWMGLAFTFCNAQDTSGNPVFQNLIADQTSSLAGTTDIQIGECIYVDINEQPLGSLYPTPLTVTAQKGPMTSLGMPSPPFTRWVIAWRTSYGYFTLDSQFGVGTTFQPASTTANGVVELNTAPFSNTNPVVVSADASGNAIAAGLSRGSGSVVPFYTAGTLAIGYGSNDTTITIGNNSSSPTILIGSGVGDITKILSAVSALGGFTTANSIVDIVSRGSAAQGGGVQILSGLSNTTPGSISGICIVANQLGTPWTGFFSIGDYTTNGIIPVTAAFNLIALPGGFNMVGNGVTNGTAGPLNIQGISSISLLCNSPTNSTGFNLNTNLSSGLTTIAQASFGANNPTLVMECITDNGSAPTASFIVNATNSVGTTTGATTLNLLCQSQTSNGATIKPSGNSTGNLLVTTSTDGTTFPFATLNIGAVNYDLSSGATGNIVPPAAGTKYAINIFTDATYGAQGSINLLAFGGAINLGSTTVSTNDIIDVRGDFLQTGNPSATPQGTGNFCVNTLILTSTPTNLPTGCPMFIFNTVTGAALVNLPTSPFNGQIVIVKQATASTGPLLIKASVNIDGTAGGAGMTISAGWGVLRFVYCSGALSQWFTW